MFDLHEKREQSRITFHFDRKFMQILSLSPQLHQAKHGGKASAFGTMAKCVLSTRAWGRVAFINHGMQGHIPYRLVTGKI